VTVGAQLQSKVTTGVDALGCAADDEAVDEVGLKRLLKRGAAGRVVHRSAGALFDEGLAEVGVLAALPRDPSLTRLLRNHGVLNTGR